MLQKGYFPVHMRFYGLWYRRKEKNSLLKQINDPKNKQNILRIEALSEEANKITQNVHSIELPQDEVYSKEMNFEGYKPIFSGENVLVVMPYIKTDQHIKKVLEREKGKRITIITTKPCRYIGRQWYENDAEIFDLTTFLSKSNQKNFIDYIIKTRNIKKIYCLNSEKIESNIETICENYEEDESLYAVYEEKYRKSKTLFGKIKRRLKRRK